MSDQNEQAVTYALTYRDVVEILRLVNESSHCESIELQLGDLRLSATRAAAALTPPAASTAFAPARAISAASAQTEQPVQEGEGAAGVQTGTGLVAVRAPMLGTFYRAPAPGEPPYVEPGDVVDEDFTIGLIDVMKLFTQISAGVAGRVVEIVAPDATLVEYGQPLMLIEPL